MSQHELNKLLKLTPLTDPPLKYAEFLAELKEHLDRADTAPALILRAIKALGEEKIEDEKDPERRQFLMTLKDVGIPSLLAFKHVCGSQRFALQMLNFLTAAGSNGAQLKKMMIVEGGPGAGKDYFGDGIERALEKGAKVYAVKGCPDHENPINLLKLLGDEQLKQLAEATGLGDTLFDILAVAGDPCQHCYTTVKGTLAEPKEEPSLECIEVEAIHVSKRSAGVSEWKPGENCSLIAALRRGNRGFVSLPDAFIKRELKPGEADERLILLDATQYRRLPAASDGCSDAAAASPLDAFIMATTNAKALSEFLDTLPDKDAFTGRSTLLKFPYNLVRVEEIRAYQQEMARYKVLAKFDPLVLKMIATLAVISRYAVPKEGENFIHPVDRLRLLQGETIQVKAKPSSEWSAVWATQESSQSRGSSYEDTRFGGYGSSSKPASTAANYGPEAMSIPTDVPITSGLMWRLIGKDEGLQGLDMRFMLGLLSQINEIGLKSKHQCVGALDAIMLLRSAIQNSLSTSNLTDGQKAVLKRCQKWLGGEVTTNNDWKKTTNDRPELIEAEYRRLLKQQVLQVFCPDYEMQAQGLYESYRAHATAFAQGEKMAKVKGIGTVPVDTSVLDDLDRYRLGKRPGDWLEEGDKKFRNALETLIDEAREKFIRDNLSKDDAELDEEAMRLKRIEIIKRFRETWETIPEIANAIRSKLDEKVGKAVEKLLTTEVTSDLTDDDQKLLASAKETLTKMGYCEALQKPVLEYAKRVKVWAYKA